MKSISNIEEIKTLKVDERLIECTRGEVNYYKFLCFHPRNKNYVILLNFCEKPVRLYYTELIERFFTNYSDIDILNYKKEYLQNELNEIEQKLSELENRNKLKEE